MDNTAIQTAKTDLKGLLNNDKVKEMLATKLNGRAQAEDFITTVLEVVRNNAMLKDADPASVLNASLMASALHLPVNSNLGFAYILPYNQKQADGTYKTVAQLQMGYKGFVQLAQRSGQFKTISATPIYEGQIVEENPLTGYVFDFKVKGAKVVGYAGYFKLLNGFEKVTYMAVEELQRHGKKYSQTYKKNYGLWETDFDAMAIKTVLKLLLAKYAPLAIMPEMQQAVLSDQAVIKDNGDLEYVDNDEKPLELDAVNGVKEASRTIEFINKAKTFADLQKYELLLATDEIKQAYENKLKELGKK